MPCATLLRDPELDFRQVRVVVDIRALAGSLVAGVGVDDVVIGPKYHWLPFNAWRISGSRAPSAFFVDDEAAMIVASTMLTPRMIQPCSSNISPWDSSSFLPS